jgi:Uma2 family endonuclease
MAATMVERRRFTVDDYYQMADAGIIGDQERVELIDGEVVIMSPIGRRHSACVSAATQALVLAGGTSVIVQPQGPVRLDRFNEPQPDLMLLRPRPDFYASQHPGPDDVLLVIEIADSSLRYDRDIKAPLYAAWGVPEYWLADLKAALLWRYSGPQNGVFTVIDELRRGDSIAPRLLPRCVVPVDAFLIE